MCIGPVPTPDNPNGIPNVLPLRVVFNERVGRLELAPSGETSCSVERAYDLGMRIGVPSDDSPLGQPYVDDFVRFIDRHVKPPGRLLEIGAGVGYLCSTLVRHGWHVMSLEPGRGYERHWKRYGADVIPDRFPSPLAPGPFEAVVLYAVLEHVRDTLTFLTQIRAHLGPGGVVLLSVPDCSDEIAAGDPGMLLHEHWQYFTEQSLMRTVRQAGFNGEVTRSTFGRCLFAAIQPDSAAQEVPDAAAPKEEEMACMMDYGNHVMAFRQRFAASVQEARSIGSVGIYCPARALYALSLDASDLRFFDDAPWIHGLFYPPFPFPVESRSDLLAQPPRTVFMMSRTFGESLCAKLSDQLPLTRFLPISLFSVADGDDSE